MAPHHRGPKWSTFYGADAVAFQQRFFDHFLKGEANGMADVPPVRLEVRSDAGTVTAVRGIQEWPPSGTSWTPLHLDASNGALAANRSPTPASTSFETGSGRSSFTWTFPVATEVIGPMRARLFIEVRGAEDVFLFVGVRKLREGAEVRFEGSYGFNRDLVTHGMLKASMRQVDEVGSLPYTNPAPMRAGEIVPVEGDVCSPHRGQPPGCTVRSHRSCRPQAPCWQLTGTALI